MQGDEKKIEVLFSNEALNKKRAKSPKTIFALILRYCIIAESKECAVH